MKTLKIIAICSAFFLTSCNQNPSLEKYFVESAEKPNFMNFDLSPSLLKTQKMKLDADQKQALEGFDKMNVLVFKKTAKNQAAFELERKKLKAILQDDKYQELMKFGMGKEGASLSYVGDDDHISEFILAGNKTDAGLAVVRITGKDMNPNNVLKMMSVLQSSNLDMKQLQPILDMLKK